MNFITNVTRSEGDPRIIRSGPSSLTPIDRLGKALGWFSIGLGIAELVAPGQITRPLGMQGKEGLVRAYGVREIASGITTLSSERQAGLWSRVAGDGVDAAALLTGYRGDNPKRGNVAVALMIVLGVTLLDLAAAQGGRARHRAGKGRRRLYGGRSGFPNGLEAARGAARNAGPRLITQRDRAAAQSSTG
jgi:hypothetical protein